MEGDGNLAESKKAETTEEKEGCLVFFPIQALILGQGQMVWEVFRLFSFCVRAWAEHFNPSYLLKLRKISPRILIFSIVCFYIHFSSPKNFNKRQRKDVSESPQ